MNDTSKKWTISFAHSFAHFDGVSAETAMKHIAHWLGMQLVHW